jgi:sugar phosphate isomerase/epimerase
VGTRGASTGEATDVIVGAQLWVFTQEPDLEARMGALLPALAQAGYDAIEGMLGHPPTALEQVEGAGLRYLAMHAGLPALIESGDAVDHALAMGATDVCASGLLRWEERSAADYEAAVPVLNALGARLRGLGLRLWYHNHEFELDQVVGERTGMDLLLAGLDPTAVGLCFDAGWAWLMGVDAPGFLRAHAERVGLIHLRDFRGRESVALGRGEMDLAAIVEVLPRLPRLRAVFVEQDPTTGDPLADMVASRAHLREALGL